MQTRDPGPARLIPTGFSTPLRRFGVASRTAQTLGIEWVDSTKQGLDDLADTAKALASARTAAEFLAIHASYLQRAGARLAARSTVTADLITTLTADLLRPPPATTSGGAH